MSDRENEIINLCKSVFWMFPHSEYNPNGADTTTCPMCHKYVEYMDAEMKDIVHANDCGYLIAKDLLTGIN